MQSFRHSIRLILKDNGRRRTDEGRFELSASVCDRDSKPRNSARKSSSYNCRGSNIPILWSNQREYPREWGRNPIKSNWVNFKLAEGKEREPTGEVVSNNLRTLAHDACSAHVAVFVIAGEIHVDEQIWWQVMPASHHRARMTGYEHCQRHLRNWGGAKDTPVNMSASIRREGSLGNRTSTD